MKISRISDPTVWHLPPTKSKTNAALVLTSVSIVLQNVGLTAQCP